MQMTSKILWEFPCLIYVCGKVFVMVRSVDFVCSCYQKELEKVAKSPQVAPVILSCFWPKLYCAYAQTAIYHLPICHRH